MVVSLPDMDPAQAIINQTLAAATAHKNKGGELTTIFVGNITDKASDTLIRQILMKCGYIVSWKRVQGASGRLQAFGFCEYSDPEAGLRSMRLLSGKQIGDKKLLVKVDSKTRAQLDAYKEQKRVESKEGASYDCETNEETKSEDAGILGEIDKLLKEQLADTTSILHDMKKTHCGAAENLDGLDMSEDQKGLVSKEIRSFRETYKNCEVCEGEHQATSRCLDCHEQMCDVVAKIHQRTKSLKGHRLVSVVSSTANSHLFATANEICPEHRDEYRYFDVECAKVLCRDCVILSHKSCTVTPLDVAAMEARKELEDSAIAEALAKLQMGFDVDDLTGKASSFYEENKRVVNDAFVQLQESLNEYMNIIMKQFEQIYKEQITAITEHQNNLMVAQTKSIESITEASQLCSDIDLLLNKEKSQESILNNALTYQALQCKPFDVSAFGVGMRCLFTGLEGNLHSDMESCLNIAVEPIASRLNLIKECELNKFPDVVHLYLLDEKPAEVTESVAEYEVAQSSQAIQCALLRGAAQSNQQGVTDQDQVNGTTDAQVKKREKRAATKKRQKENNKKQKDEQPMVAAENY